MIEADVQYVKMLSKKLGKATSIIDEATAGTMHARVSSPAVDHAQLVYAKAANLTSGADGGLNAEDVERLVIIVDAEMGSAKLSSDQIDTFVTIVLLLIDSKRFMNHFLSRWRVKPEGTSEIIDRFVRYELTFKEFVHELRPHRIR